MRTTRYKPLFSVSSSYQLTGIDVSTEGIEVVAMPLSDGRMNDLKLLPQYKNDTATIFYKGTEAPSVNPVTSEPDLEISSDEYFYFGIKMANKEKIARLKFHTTPAKATEIGFPVLYDASIKVLNGPPVVEIRDDVKLILPVFTFTAIAADTGIAADYASLEIRNEQNNLVDLNMDPVKINDKAIDGVSAVPEFAFSVDASQLEPGIYEFKVGNFKKKYFVANRMDTVGEVAVVRVLKNSFLEYKKTLADKTFAQFELLIPPA